MIVEDSVVGLLAARSVEMADVPIPTGLLLHHRKPCSRLDLAVRAFSTLDCIVVVGTARLNKRFGVGSRLVLTLAEVARFASLSRLLRR